MTRDGEPVHMMFLTPNAGTIVAWPSCPDCGLKCARFETASRCPDPTILDVRDELGEAGA
jgi:hypothetical protein